MKISPHRQAFRDPAHLTCLYPTQQRQASSLFALFTAIASFGIGSTVQANAISTLLFLSGVIVRETRKYLWEGDIDQDGLPSGGAEWEEAHLQQAPMCFCEWEADDCYGAEQTHDNMKYCNFPPAGYNPQNIERDLKATAVRHNLHIFSKWAKCQSCQLEQLHTEGNADDSKTHQQAKNRIINSYKESSQKEPQNITQSTQFH